MPTPGSNGGISTVYASIPTGRQGFVYDSRAIDAVEIFEVKGSEGGLEGKYIAAVSSFLKTDNNNFFKLFNMNYQCVKKK